MLKELYSRLIPAVPVPLASWPPPGPSSLCCPGHSSAALGGDLLVAGRHFEWVENEDDWTETDVDPPGE